MNNIGKAFANPKIRGIFIVFVLAAVVILGISYLRLKSTATPGVASASRVGGAPAIESIPGSANASREYVKLQEEQNVRLAEEATKRGTAAIPTITRTTYVDSGVGGDISGCSIEDLNRARSAGVTAAELRCRGCSLTALKAAGFSAGELHDAGFSAGELKAAGFSVQELKAAGFSAQELAQAGFATNDLIKAGFSAADLRAAGFDAATLKAAGFSAADLRTAGFKARDLAKVGFSGKELAATGYSVTSLRNAGLKDNDLKALGFDEKTIKTAAAAKSCNLPELRKLRAQGVKLAGLRNLGCSIAGLKAAGFTADELKAAGYNARELKDAGFGAAELRAAGFDPQSLKDAGFSAQELKDAGVSVGELKAAGFNAGELRKAGISADALRAAGFNAKELRVAGFSPQQMQRGGFSADDLKTAGFSDGDLIRAGFARSQIDGNSQMTAAPQVVANPQECSVERLARDRANGVSVLELKNRGCNVAALKSAGFNAAELRAAGFSAADLKNAGISDQDSARSNLNTAATDIFQGRNLGENVMATDTAGEQQQGWQQQLAAMRAQEARQLSAQEYQDKMKQLQQSMSTQANDLFAAWSPLPTQQFVQGPVDQVDASGKKVVSGGAASYASDNTSDKAVNNNIMKAGSILFAVLETGVNSDEKSPVMATIVDGPLKGSRVLGNFQRVNKKVLLKFNLLNVPNLPASVAVNAVAIDPNTARTALATHVDNHYLLRYGTVFAASFMSGIGQSVQDSGNSVQINTSTGETVNFHGSTNLSKAAVVGLGEVGNRFADVLTPLINKPPTVEVKAGSGIGILLMADLGIPKTVNTK